MLDRGKLDNKKKIIQRHTLITLISATWKRLVKCI